VGGPGKEKGKSIFPSRKLGRGARRRHLHSRKKDWLKQTVWGGLRKESSDPFGKRKVWMGKEWDGKVTKKCLPKKKITEKNLVDNTRTGGDR